MFKVKQLSVSVEGKKIIKSVSFALQPGTLSLCMGPNGSGKSSLVNALAGHHNYTIDGGDIELNQHIITNLPPEKRARVGLFLSVQNPVALPGVAVNTLLKESFRALHPNVPMEEFQKRLTNALELLELDTAFLARSLNDGFSGGEKKRCEMLQLLVLQPKVALLDEIDSGLDVDAVKCVGNALNWFIKKHPESSLFVITHYQNILQYIVPDQVLVMHNGILVKTGDKNLVTSIGKSGYEQFSKA